MASTMLKNANVRERVANPDFFDSTGHLKRNMVVNPHPKEARITSDPLPPGIERQCQM